MADQEYEIGMAVGVQADIDTLNGTISALAGTLDETDGIVLGDPDSGDFESGISAPSFVRESREQSDVEGGFRSRHGTFLRVDAQGLEITWAVKGNGTTSTGGAGEAKPDPGIDALHEMGGLAGVNGAGEIYEYTSRTNASAGGIVRYGTVKLWVGDLAWVLKSCTCSSLKFTVQPSGIILATAVIDVGNVESFTDPVTFPTFDYGNQESLQPNTVENVTTSFGAVRGWESLEFELATELFRSQDSARTGGLRTAGSGREVNVTSRLYVASSASGFEYLRVVETAAPTNDLGFQLGTAAAGSGTINALLVDVRNVEVASMKPTPEGDVMIADIEGRATSPIAGNSEIGITYN